MKTASIHPLAAILAVSLVLVISSCLLFADYSQRKIQLYIRQNPSNIRVWSLETVDPKQANQLEYPWLYLEGRDQGVIVIFGFPSCAACKVQENLIPADYRLLVVNKNLSNSPGGPTWRDLMDQWGFVRTVYPTTVIVVNGIPTKHFVGTVETSEQTRAPGTKKLLEIFGPSVSKHFNVISVTKVKVSRKGGE